VTERRHGHYIKAHDRIITSVRHLDGSETILDVRAYTRDQIVILDFDRSDPIEFKLLPNK
jgi:hypothetical protein